MKKTHADKVADVRERYDMLHPSACNLIPYFDYDHLPEHLQDVSREFNTIAHTLCDGVQDRKLRGPELTVALRKLLEAKDCAVRAAL